MTIDLAVQRATAFEASPSDADFERWVGAALRDVADAELTVRLVDEGESRELNHRYRGKDTPTNVLSFAADLPDAVGLALLGDVVICAPLVAAEAGEQGKPEQAHWAHLTVHGVLHLLGYDHQQEADARKMEGLETEILESLGIGDPYA